MSKTERLNSFLISDTERMNTLSISTTIRMNNFPISINERIEKEHFFRFQILKKMKNEHFSDLKNWTKMNSFPILNPE